MRRNVRTPYGEIDLIVKKDDEIVFVEVKTRSTSSYGFPEASITANKQQHLIDAAEFYFAEKAMNLEEWRIDVIAIRGFPGGPPPEIIHFENAISGN